MGGAQCMSNSDRPGEKQNMINWKQKKGQGNQKNKKSVLAPEVRASVIGAPSDNYYTEYIPRHFDLGRSESTGSLSSSVIETRTKEDMKSDGFKELTLSNHETRVSTKESMLHKSVRSGNGSKINQNTGIYDPYSQESNCIDLTVISKVVNSLRNCKLRMEYIYQITISDINRFSGQNSNQHSGQKIFKWKEQENAPIDQKSKLYKKTTLEDKRRKVLKLPFKFKYLNCEVVFEVSSRIARTSDESSDEEDDQIQDKPMLLYKVQYNFRDVISNLGSPYSKCIVVAKQNKDSESLIMMKEFKTTTKTLLSFCIQIPQQVQSQESIFKGSRLMFHELINQQDQEWVDVDVLNGDKSEEQVVSKNSKLEIIKITQCKMKQKDILELQIGLKTLQYRDKPFDERQFVLKFLNKLDPQLPCKGQVVIDGSDLEQLQEMQFKVLQQNAQNDEKSKKKKIKEDQPPPKLTKDFTNQGIKLQDCYLLSPLAFKQQQISIIDLIPDHIHVQPIICIDFSLANLTFSSNGTSVHTPNDKKANQYRDLMELICLDMFSGDLFMPIFGYGAKTFKGSSETCNIFPMSMNMSNPLIPNQQHSLKSSYAKCLETVKLDLPVKLAPMLLFLKNVAQSVRDNQIKAVQTNRSKAHFPQIFYQASILTTGIIDDIDDVLKSFECNQWAGLPMQIVFINIFQRNIEEDDLDTLKLIPKINKYNNEIAGWKQLCIKFLARKDLKSQYQDIGHELTSSISKNIEDYLFVNQLTNIQQIQKLKEKSESPMDQKQLIQESYQIILDIMEQRHNKLFEIVKKRKIGISKKVFDLVIQSGDMFEWSVQATLHAAQNHDQKVIQEANSDEEFTQLYESRIEDGPDSDGIQLDDVQQMLHQSMMNNSVMPESNQLDIDDQIEEVKSEGAQSNEEER